jgi:hypothetical protein
MTGDGVESTPEKGGSGESPGALAKPVFLRWERLRPWYNAILALVFFLSHPDFYRAIADGRLIALAWAAGAILANMCFFAGPLLESYLAWLGFRSPLTTPVIFLCGSLISIPCVILFDLPFAFGG